MITHDRHHYALVLLVQPDRDDRDMYQEFLQHRGFLTVVVSSASDALLVAPRADVIVTGLMLPGPIDGIEFIRRLKTDDRTTAIPVLVLTAWAWQTDRDRAVAAGCDAFLAKPCLPDTFVTEIDHLLVSSRGPKPARPSLSPPRHRETDRAAAGERLQPMPARECRAGSRED